MISPDTLKKNTIFAPLNDEQIQHLIKSSHEVTLQSGEFLFQINRELKHFYLVIEGELEVIIESTKLEIPYETYGQPGQLHSEYVVLSTVEPDGILGWSGLVPPHKATSGVRAKAPSKLLAFDCKYLLQCFEKDCSFGYYILHIAAQVIGKRLQDIYKGG